MKVGHLSIIGVILCLTGLAPAQAMGEEGVVPTPPESQAVGRPSITLEYVLGAVLRGSPRAAAARWNTKAAEGRSRQAVLWANPEVSFRYENFGWDRPWGRGSEISMEVTQAVPIGGRKSAAREVGTADESAAQADGQVLLGETLLMGRVAFYEALAANDRVRLAEEALQIALSALAMVEQSVLLGGAAQADAYRFTVEVEAARVRVIEGKASLRAATNVLNALLGAPPNQATELEGSLAPPGERSGLSATWADPAQLALARRSNAVCHRAKALAELREAEAIPDMIIGAGVRGNDAFDQGAFIVSLSIPIPVIDRNQGAIDEARADERMACFLAQAEMADLMGQVEALDARQAGLWEQYRRATQQLVPAAVAAFDAVQQGFKQGKVRASELLEARRRLIGIQEDLIDTALDYQRTSAELDFLTGRLLEATDGGQP